MVIIGASQALDPGSIPGERMELGHWRNRKRACFASTRYGDRNPDAPHFLFFIKKKNNKKKLQRAVEIILMTNFVFDALPRSGLPKNSLLRRGDFLASLFFGLKM